MFKFIILIALCWLGLFVLGVIFISERRKKTLLLRSFVRLAKNRSPERWTIRECIEDSGFYEIDGESREYYTEIAGFCLTIGKYPKKKRKNGEEIICYSYRMFVSTKEVCTIFQDDKRITRAYNQIDQEHKRREKVIKKLLGSDARIEKSDILVPAPA